MTTFIGVIITLFAEVCLILWGGYLCRNIKETEYRGTDEAFDEEFKRAMECLMELSTDPSTIDKVMENVNTREQAIALRIRLEKILKPNIKC